MISDSQENIEKSYEAKVVALKLSNPDFDQLSAVERWEKMDLTDDELWYVGTLEVLAEEKSMEMEGFGLYDSATKEKAITDRIQDIRNLIEDVKKRD